MNICSFRNSLTHVPKILMALSLIGSANAWSATTWSGYYDFEVRKQNVENQPTQLQQHHLSTFLQYNAKFVTFFTEIEYEFAPSHKYGTTQKGNFLIETAWANVEISKLLQVKMGTLLVPTWYQRFHYPNVVHTIDRPNMIRNVFPASDNAIMLHGEMFQDSGIALSYMTWIGNGSKETYAGEKNSDGQFSKGARLEAKNFPLFDNSELGLMYMYDPNAAKASHVAGVDLVLDYENIGFNSAFHRNMSTNEYGYYVIPSFTQTITGLHHVTGYLDYNIHEKAGTKTTVMAPGIRYGYGVPLSVKLEYTHSSYNTAAPTSHGVAAQFALFFD